MFGNAELEETERTARTLTDKLRGEGLHIPDISRGAATAGVASTKAQAGLRDALADGLLTILPPGPLKNVAAALQRRPDLQGNVVRIMAVMDRRSGYIFHFSEGDLDRMARSDDAGSWIASSLLVVGG